MKIAKINNREQLYKGVLEYEKRIIDTALTDSAKKQYYGKRINIPKKGGSRGIYCVDSNTFLYEVQKSFAKNFLNNIPNSDAAHGFVKGKNYYSFLNAHVYPYSRISFLRLDIKDFFESITSEMVRNSLDYYVSNDDPRMHDEVLNIMTDIVCYEGRLIQGSPTSPAISNIVFRPVDIRIERYCMSQGVVYSRYADDLLFSSISGTQLSERFISGIKAILKDNHFRLNLQKTIRSVDYISLKGFVIEGQIRLSRKKTKSIRQVLYFLEKNRYENTNAWMSSFKEEMEGLGNDSAMDINNSYSLKNYLAGMRAFIISSIKESGDIYYKKRAAGIISRIEKQIDEIENKG
ncbi:MAG: RNA-directed DNA polymerase [Lachnospiraceae bacterium]|nr:RNA-directed DNA polymerase [Lachnospiraceae bacterium]